MLRQPLVVKSDSRSVYTLCECELENPVTGSTPDRSAMKTKFKEYKKIIIVKIRKETKPEEIVLVEKIIQIIKKV